MKATISPKLLTLIFASSLWPREDSDEATFTSIDLPDATVTVALDINSAGEIVGRYIN